MEKLSPEDRQTLCTRVDMLAVLAGDGVAVNQAGNHWICTLRAERTPSCHVYPPGVGRRGNAGWTLHDFGDGTSVDALGYLVDVRGVPFMDAVRELAQLAGFTPECLRADATPAPKRKAAPPPTPPPQTGPPPMTLEEQTTAACILWTAILEMAPDANRRARRAAQEYLESRGCRHGGNLALLMEKEHWPELLPVLACHPQAELLFKAGLLKAAGNGKPLRMAWWDRVLLLACSDPDGHRPVYIVGRRLDWREGDRAGKYINQPTAGGATRQPFNLSSLYDNPGKECLIVEGPMDALGAGALGWPAVAMLCRPQAHSYDDRHGAAAKMLEPHLPALRDARLVRVVPDADGGEKGADGEALAARLVAWLRAAGCRATVSTVADMCPAAPPECKDLADVAKTRTNL